MFKSLIFLLMVICCSLVVSESALSQMSPEGIKAMREGMAKARMKDADKKAMKDSDNAPTDTDAARRRRSRPPGSKAEMKKEMKDMKEPTEGSSFKLFDVKPKTLMAVLDSDGDGQLSGKEIDFATDQLLRLDVNDNGQIDPDELPGVMMAAKEDPAGFDAAYKGPGEQVYKTIAGFDTDGNGLLSRSEMRAEYKGAFRSIDLNGNREISPKELLEFSQKQ